MKKFFTTVILGIFAIAMLNVTKAVEVTPESQLPKNCIAYNDGCNVCSKVENGQRVCTMRACLNGWTPNYTCTAYATGAIIGEGDLTSGPVSPEFQTQCKNGLSSLNPYATNMVGGGMLCYDASKGEPVCKSVGVAQEGWYYPTGVLLRAMSCPVVDEPVACTMQYDPVCAAVQVQCIKAPCPAIPETFGNTCMMNANKNATFLYKGECKVDETPVACTKEYMPVCGVDLNQNEQTYGNKCMLEADNAVIKYAGECKKGLEAGEGFVYGKVSSVLDQSYLAWKYTPIQAYNYTQTIIDKIDAKLKVSRMKKWAYDRHIQLKRFLQTYMSILNITQ